MTTMKHHVLVTGAGGFVCRHIVEAMLRHGYTLLAIDQTFDPELQANWERRWGRQITVLETDASTLPDVAVDGLVHGAAVTASPEEAGQTPEANLRANLNSALAALEWAARQKTCRVILLSSSAVFRATPPGPVFEDQPTSPQGVYAIAKQALEAVAASLRADYGRDVAAVRLSNLYGPGETARSTRPRTSLVARLVKQAAETGCISLDRPDETRDWTFAPDIGEAVHHLMQRPMLKHALYHVASEQVLTARDIATVITTQMPGMTVEVRPGDDPGTAPLQRRGYLSNRRLREETGFSAWTPFESGIRQVIDWQRQLEFER
jgi:nucleoside-diphosphate-sugar epimerase